MISIGHGLFKIIRNENARKRHRALVAFFSLERYQQELGKDFNRITLFLCTSFDYKTSQGLNDNDDSWNGSDNSASCEQLIYIR